MDSREVPELTGYADRFTVATGERIRFMVYSDSDTYTADIVRLIRGDAHPDGPGFKEQVVETPVSAVYPGHRQTTRTGSFVRVERDPALEREDFTVAAWIYPTLPQAEGRQGMLAKWDAAEERGYALLLEADGRLTFLAGDGTERVHALTMETPLRRWGWYFV